MRLTYSPAQELMHNGVIAGELLSIFENWVICPGRIEMQALARRTLWSILAVICATATLSAADVEIHGVVTTKTGKPVRGALVKAIAGDKSVSRFTQQDGRYEITVPAGSYDVTVDAYGFAGKRQTTDAAQAGETNFTLTPRFDMTRLTSADLQELLPDNEQTKLIRKHCLACHSFGRIINKRGYTASEWQNFFPVMTRGKLPLPTLKEVLASPEQTGALTAALEKYFGPDAPYFGPDADPITTDQIKHTDLTDAALKATIREYTIPTPDSYPHSITVDLHDNPWFSETHAEPNKVGRFDPETEKFVEYTVPISNSMPHTGVVSQDGRYFWVTLFGDSKNPLAAVDRETGKVTTYDFPGNEGRTHTPALDREGNVWCSGSTLLKFDVRTKKFKEYKLPIPPALEGTVQVWGKIPGQPPDLLDGFVYDVKADSKGNIWSSIQNSALIIRLDPATGETKTFHPDTPSVKGLAVDANDNIWFAGFQGNRIGRLDPRTGTIKLYRLPTTFATPYGLALDKKSGYVWYADLNGNNVTRFDPKTEQFDEYPLPTNNSSPRFIELDSKGRLWFTEFMNGKIGMVDPGGERKQVSSFR
jgi:virginiamycin B lyase